MLVRDLILLASTLEPPAPFPAAMMHHAAILKPSLRIEALTGAVRALVEEVTHGSKCIQIVAAAGQMAQHSAWCRASHCARPAEWARDSRARRGPASHAGVSCGVGFAVGVAYAMYHAMHCRIANRV